MARNSCATAVSSSPRRPSDSPTGRLGRTPCAPPPAFNVVYLPLMSQPAIVIEGVSKRYRIGRPTRVTRTWRGALAEAVRNHWRRLCALGEHGDNDETIWALRDVHLAIAPGEVVGFIGRNGAGKSTLLKILSRIVTPTAGRICTRGRIGSLLEVGTGFHPELTGRENIFLNGAILGMQQAEIRAAFDEIVAFAEIGKFLDTPVKRYSSGMYVRLAFAVAAHLNPEILLIDEVLAVGDTQFQKKCLGKIGDIAHNGRTVIFVSHNMNAIRSLCSRVVLLQDARVAADGPPDAVISQYLAASAPDHQTRSEATWPDDPTAPGCDEFRLRRVRLCDGAGRPLSVVDVNQPCRIEIEYRVTRPISGMRVAMQLVTPDGVTAFGSTDHAVQLPVHQPGHYRSVCEIPARLLNTQTYLLRVGAGQPGIKYLLEAIDCLWVEVAGAANTGSVWAERWPGVVCPRLSWQVQTVPAAAAQPTTLCAAGAEENH